MTVIALDCEFNGHGGELISLALVADDGGQFYMVWPKPVATIVYWVQEHVMPVLNDEGYPLHWCQSSLALWLSKYRGATIVAVWPQDFVHFCQQITYPEGRRADWDGTMVLVSGVALPSAVPHNALEDAKALLAGWKLRRHE